MVRTTRVRADQGDNLAPPAEAPVTVARALHRAWEKVRATLAETRHDVAAKAAEHGPLEAIRNRAQKPQAAGSARDGQRQHQGETAECPLRDAQGVLPMTS